MNDSNIILNPDDQDFRRREERREGMVGLVMRLSGGKIRNEAAASYILLFFAIALFVISGIIIATLL
ncbi:MAG: hypothetical protein AAB455_02625 [Patescibacteria group bacterium]